MGKWPFAQGLDPLSTQGHHQHLLWGGRRQAGKVLGGETGVLGFPEWGPGSGESRTEGLGWAQLIQDPCGTLSPAPQPLGRTEGEWLVQGGASPGAQLLAIKEQDWSSPGVRPAPGLGRVGSAGSRLRSCRKPALVPLSQELGLLWVPQTLILLSPGTWRAPVEACLFE